MESESQVPSPWWYRQRGSLIGAVYGAGFLIGNISLGAVPPPAYVAWGGSPAGAAALAWTGIACCAAAWLVRASGTAYLRREVVFAGDALQDRLVVAGPFRFVRNPLYLGNLFLAAGVGLYAPPAGFAIIVVGNAFIAVLLAREEARQLAVRFGPLFERYRRAVPAFVPRLTPADVEGSITVAPSYRSALIGEAGILLATVSLVPLALFGNAGLPAFAVILTAAVAVAIGFNRASNRTRGTRPKT